MSIFTPIIANPPQVKRVQWNPADATARIVYSNGNLTGTHDGTGGGRSAVRATRGHATGKYYFECVYNVITGANTPNWGVVDGAYSLATLATDGTVGFTAGSGWGMMVGSPSSNPAFFFGNSVGPTTLSPAIAATNVGQCWYDMTAGKVWFGNNNTVYGGGNPTAGTGALFSGLTGTLYPVLVLATAAGINCQMTAHFIAKEFVYQPTGFSQV